MTFSPPPAAARAPRPVPPRLSTARPAPRARFADRRGLTGAGAVVAALAVTLAAGILDALIGSPSDPTLRTLFTIALIGSSVAAALLVHREQVLVAMVAPPLIYATVVLVSGGVHAITVGGALVKPGLLDAATSFVTDVPALLVATALAVLIGLARGIGARSARRRSARPPARP